MTTTEIKAGGRMKVNVADTSNLTASDWKQLRFTGVLIKGDRIIRTLDFMKRSEAGARKEIECIAKRMFGSKAEGK